MINKNNRTIKQSYDRFINAGIYLSGTIMLMFGLIIFFTIEIFFAPLKEHIWFPLLIICCSVFFVLLSLNYILLGKIIVNNNVFLNDKNDKKYFFAAIILFLINNFIGLFMFKKLLKNNDEVTNG